MMRTLIAVNLGRDPVEPHHSAAAAAELLDILEVIDDYAVERSADDEVVVLFDADLPDVMRVMTVAWYLVHATALEGVELIVSGAKPSGVLRATFGSIPPPRPTAWPESEVELQDFPADFVEETLMMC